MKRLDRIPFIRWLLRLGVLLGAVPAFGQSNDPDEPQWLRLDTPNAMMDVGVDVEGLNENLSQSGPSSNHHYLSVIPLVGGSLQGSIYHPNLVSFDMSAEGGYGWMWDTTTSDPGTTTVRNEKQNLLRFFTQINFLDSKPYHAAFTAAQDHTYRNYDFFNTATVDTLRYNGLMSWKTGGFDLVANAGYRQEQSSSLNGYSSIADTYLNFNGTHTRDSGSSALVYGFDQYANQLNAEPVQNSVNNYISISDSETFGSRKQINTTAGINFSEYEYFAAKTDSVNANGHATVNHTPDLDSFCTLNYTHNSVDPAVSSIFQGVVGLRHRLYESLLSTLDVHGTTDNSSSRGNSIANDRYGVGLREDYTKKLGDTSRLNVGGGIIIDHEDHETTGMVLTTIDEQHTLFLTTSPSYRPAYLNNPRAIPSSIQVRTQTGIPATLNLDYQLIPVGELTEVRLIIGSTVLQNGGAVMVTYQSLPPPSSSYQALNGFAQIRFDFFNLFGVYGRLNWLDNNAPPSVMAETLTDVVAGADLSWRWARAGAEYEDFNSNFAQYKDWRFFENFSFQPGETVTLGVDFNQIFYQYPDGRRNNQYQFIGRFNSQLTPWLWWNVEGGYYKQSIFGDEQNLVAARTDLTCGRGKLNLKTGYQYNYQQTRQQGGDPELRDRNYFYVTLRRYF